ncbi:EscU/YscU/HrcU family type III secretion system export apparatus switch protein [Salicibibacter cibarius]|uniref:EscU/YscU/HrcU family type III secretion system export apparatus switch protein n=1 Tax=Salicibibacter cibarius TaxID=2743000 RepID=A0A7T6Z4F8_9BACI|nr:EscU/YscU/HrcU family type III secretion system export apparatus switch protein [Salicibibacter cibarius]QQK76612.1 EscU/YscU/HrcU family type III secretion system export apparatus switch protein [Salicibibacter cibarius]
MCAYKDKRRTAAALTYRQAEDIAPVVKAKGHGAIAEDIIARARENDVPVREDETLAELLDQLEIGTPIPADLYEVIAEVFAFIYKVDAEMKD